MDTAKEVIPQLRSEGRVRRAYLGITGIGIDQSLAPLDLKASSGVLVQTVTPGGPADDAGIEGGDPGAGSTAVDGSAVALGGDVIQAIDGKPVDSMDDVVAAVARGRPGAAVTVRVLRAGRSRDVRPGMQGLVPP